MTPEDLNAKSSSIFGGFMNALKKSSNKPSSFSSQSPESTPKAGSLSESVIDLEKPSMDA